MLIKMKTLAAGPPGTLNAKPGDIVDVTDMVAKMLLSGGHGSAESPVVLAGPRIVPPLVQAAKPEPPQEIEEPSEPAKVAPLARRKRGR